MNAGRIIILAFIAFAAFIGSMVFQAFSRDADLVRDDYYENEINYDNNRQSEVNYKALEAKVDISQQASGVVITFPEGINSTKKGKVKFYRADNKDYDRSFKLKLNKSGQQLLDYENFHEGNYEISIEWKDEQGKSYLLKESIDF